MKRIQVITNEINKLTLKIEEEYPELYKYLDENPITMPNAEHPDMGNKVFAEYLASLKDLLEHHIETHQNQNNKPK